MVVVVVVMVAVNPVLRDITSPEIIHIYTILAIYVPLANIKVKAIALPVLRVQLGIIKANTVDLTATCTRIRRARPESMNRYTKARASIATLENIKMKTMLLLPVNPAQTAIIKTKPPVHSVLCIRIRRVHRESMNRLPPAHALIATLENTKIKMVKAVVNPALPGNTKVILVVLPVPTTPPRVQLASMNRQMIGPTETVSVPIAPTDITKMIPIVHLVGTVQVGIIKVKSAKLTVICIHIRHVHQESMNRKSPPRASSARPGITKVVLVILDVTTVLTVNTKVATVLLPVMIHTQRRVHPARINRESLTHASIARQDIILRLVHRTRLVDIVQLANTKIKMVKVVLNFVNLASTKIKMVKVVVNLARQAITYLVAVAFLVPTTTTFVGPVRFNRQHLLLPRTVSVPTAITVNTKVKTVVLLAPIANPDNTKIKWVLPPVFPVH